LKVRFEEVEINFTHQEPKQQPTPEIRCGHRSGRS
jgi:hypothetical protein